MKSEELNASLKSRLAERANPRTKAWWEAYMKQVIPFRGVKMAGVRSALHEWYEYEEVATRLTFEEQRAQALALFREEHAEDKIAGILFLQEILLPAGAIRCREDISRFADLFKGGSIFDWNTCDWFCVKVLGPLVQREGELCARAISEWRTAENPWQRRAAGVAFVNLARRGDWNFGGFTDLLLEICTATVGYSERFSQTGTGWVLRELSIAAPERVECFLEEHLCELSSEGLRYASKKLPVSVRRRMRESHRECQ